MEWTPPKIDWSGNMNGSTYTGDYFNYTDYNRIRNNLIFLIGYASSMYNVTQFQFGEEKTETDLIFSDEFNSFENALSSINSETYNYSYQKKEYFENGYTPNFDDLNRIEGLMLKIYKTLVAQKEAQRRLAFTLGGQKGIKV